MYFALMLYVTTRLFSNKIDKKEAYWVFIIILIYVIKWI